MRNIGFLKSLVFFLLFALLIFLTSLEPLKKPIETESTTFDAVIIVDFDLQQTQAFDRGYEAGLANDTLTFHRYQRFQLLHSNIIQQTLVWSFEQGWLIGQADFRKKLESK